MLPDDIKGLDSLMKDAVELKFIPEPLNAKQVAELVQLSEADPGRSKKKKAPRAPINLWSSPGLSVIHFPGERRVRP